MVSGLSCDLSLLSFLIGVSVHLIVTNCPEKRQRVLKNRKEHFTTSLPTVDHIAFVTNDTAFVESVLIREKVFYRRFDPDGTNITQLFILDPDGNVIEVSSCGIPVGETKCLNQQSQSDSRHSTTQLTNEMEGYSSNIALENADPGATIPRYVSRSDSSCVDPTQERRPASREDFLICPKQNSVMYSLSDVIGRDDYKSTLDKGIQ